MMNAMLGTSHGVINKHWIPTMTVLVMLSLLLWIVWRNQNNRKKRMMRKPKLKNYFVAISPDEYREFETSRTLRIRPASIDIVTGRITGRPVLYLAARPDIVDNIVREQYRYNGNVYILRVPADCVDRDQLTPVEGGTETWQYARDLVIPHCAVYQYAEV
jgi:hypothetical protein